MELELQVPKEDDKTKSKIIPTKYKPKATEDKEVEAAHQTQE